MIIFVDEREVEIGICARFQMTQEHPIHLQFKTALKERYRFVVFIVMWEVMKPCSLNSRAREFFRQDGARWFRCRDCCREQSYRGEFNKSQHDLPPSGGISARLSHFVLIAIFALAASPVYSDDSWLQFNFPNLEIYTDMGEEEAVQLGQHIVHFKALLDQYMPVQTASSADTPRLRMLVFSRRADFVRLMKPRHFAAFTQPTLRETLLVIAPSRGRESLYVNVRHELVHYQLRRQAVGYPPWFDEGSAVMLEHLELSSSGGEISGTLDTRALFNAYRGAVRARRGLSLARMVEANDFRSWPLDSLHRFYGLMGQFVHFLKLGHTEGFTDLQYGLEQYLLDRRRGISESLGLSMNELESQFSRYRKLRKKPPFALYVDSVEAEFSVRTMTRSDVARVKGRAAESTRPEKAVSLFRQVADLEPTDPQAWIELARAQLVNRKFDEAEGSLDRADHLLAQPDAGALIQRAILALRGCGSDTLVACTDVWQEASELTRRALELDPTRLDGIYLQGLVDLYRGRPGVAVSYLQAVYRYVPWAPRVNYHLGECLRILGDPSAHIYLQNALAWSSDENWSALAERSLQMYEDEFQ